MEAEVAEAELLELSFRANLHAHTLAELDAHADRAGAATTNAAQAAAEAHEHVEAAAQAHAEAQWRFGGNYSPQHYGQWRMNRGTWSFGNDKRFECEACAYVLYALIDRLGDEFSRTTIKTESALLCPRIQWVFRSACDFIVVKNQQVVSDLIMKLVEPVDACKHLTLCPPDWWDLMGVGGMQGYGAGRAGAVVPPAYRSAYGVQGGGGPAVPVAAVPGVLPPQWSNVSTVGAG